MLRAVPREGSWTPPGSRPPRRLMVWSPARPSRPPTFVLGRGGGWGGPVPPVRRPGIVRVFAVASRALRDAARLPSASLDPTLATLGLAAIRSGGELGGQ